MVSYEEHDGNLVHGLCACHKHLVKEPKTSYTRNGCFVSKMIHIESGLAPHPERAIDTRNYQEIVHIDVCSTDGRLIPLYNWNGCMVQKMLCIEDGSAPHTQGGALQTNIMRLHAHSDIYEREESCVQGIVAWYHNQIS